jgi:hypothetical protein
VATSAFALFPVALLPRVSGVCHKKIKKKSSQEDSPALLLCCLSIRRKDLLLWPGSQNVYELVQASYKRDIAGAGFLSQSLPESPGLLCSGSVQTFNRLLTWK